MLAAEGRLPFCARLQIATPDDKALWLWGMRLESPRGHSFGGCFLSLPGTFEFSMATELGLGSDQGFER